MIVKIIAEIKDNKIIGYSAKRFFKQEMTDEFIESEITVGTPIKYLKYEGGEVLEMSAAEKTAADLPDLKIIRESEISVIREDRIKNGFLFQGFKIKADPDSQRILMQFMIRELLASGTYPIQWRTADNLFMPINDPATLKSLLLAMSDFTTTKYNNSYSSKDSIEQAADKTEIEAIYNSYLNN